MQQIEVSQLGRKTAAALLNLNDGEIIDIVQEGRVIGAFVAKRSKEENTLSPWADFFEFAQGLKLYSTVEDVQEAIREGRE